MLHRPWLAPIIVAFWCVTTGWLLVAKVAPALRPGSPPGYQALYASGSRLVPVAWTVHWNGSPLGWALTEARRPAAGGMQVDSRLHFDRLPIDEVLPAWAGLLVQRTLGQQASTAFDAVGHLEIDAAGRLRGFSSAVTLPGALERVVLTGRVDDGRVAITMRAGDLTYEVARHLPDHLLIGDELSPQATLPGLYEGRRWTVPVYSPLRPGQAPLQILHAEVGGEETIFWANRLVSARVVTYREDPTSPREPRCRLWVDRSGRVLKHESALLGAKLEFLRRTDDDAARLAATVAAEAAREIVP